MFGLKRFLSDEEGAGVVEMILINGGTYHVSIDI